MIELSDLNEDLYFAELMISSERFYDPYFYRIIEIHKYLTQTTVRRSCKKIGSR